MQPEPDTQVIPPRRLNDTPAPPASPRAEVEPVILRRWVGRYELIHRLAHGGMATVYLGRAKGKAGFEKIVAVKVIHPHLASEAEFVGMFLDEARIAARIHHPHVVEILDLGESDGVYFMVMEFIEGENLAALVRALKGELLPVPVILQLMADTLEGLSAAHELRDAQGQRYELVHRDVSPHNILINLDGWAKVGDFGIMKAAGKASNTKTGELRGKLAYMSPEQARGDSRVDHRTDLFALGVITWELLTGQRLFACPTEAATLEKVIACDIPAFTDVRAKLGVSPLADELGDGLTTLLARVLAPDPQQRYTDTSEMLSEVKRLRRLADDLPSGAEVEQHEPRAYLGEQMRRFFLRRVKYARAALRKTGEHDALVSSSREWLVEPTMQVGRPSTGSNPTLPEIVMTPTGAASIAPAVAEPGRPSTGSNPALLNSASHPHLAGSGTNQSPVAQWTMWLLLPMLGAGIAVAAMLVLAPGVNRGAEGGQDPPASEQAAEPEPEQEQPDSPAPRTRAASSYAATEIKPVPQAPAGMIRWWFSSTPAGAQVFIANEAHGQTPTSVDVPISETPLDIRVELEGYQPHTQQLSPVKDNNIFPQLQPLAPTPVSAAKVVKRPRKLSKGKTAANSPDDDGSPKPDEDKKTFVPVPDSLRESGG